MRAMKKKRKSRKDRVEHVFPKGSLYPYNLDSEFWPSDEQMGSGDIKVLSLMYVKTKEIAGLFWIYSRDEEDADRIPPEIVKDLGYDSVAVFKLHKVVKPEGANDSRRDD